ncbi:hypothetical protein [Aminobacter sp. MDW-2]|jgi:hypothetical protein|uniref:hypothetical protein n=1 Tax=Aminobacter TaxID=31988 RepID=UPI0012AFA6F7|nr:hypothetical protein [Aminobacter sp. MDW-2]MRX33396.1 hypothetical protein [Aminobacter sp. MDW-2]QNH33546.1 hypothetical protein H5P29_24060 [Aminobacter sp. MDW-2]
MKTIMMAAAVSLLLAPTAYAAAPVANEDGAKAAISAQATKDDAVRLAAGRNRSGSIGLPRSNGLVPGRGFGLG